MNSLNQNVHAYGNNSRPKISSIRKDYPSEVEEVYRRDSQRMVYKMAGEWSEERGFSQPLRQCK